MSEHKAVVIPINLIKHPNADSLSINEFGGYTTVLRTEDWEDKKLGIFIEPDTIVKTTRPEFSFLDPSGKNVRIKAKRLRQVWSMGLTIPAPEGAVEGQDFWTQLELEHYEPELAVEAGSTRGNWAKAPAKWEGMTKYDVDNGRKTEYNEVFTPGEIVQVSYKLNGANVCYVYSDGQLHVRSRSGFRERENNLFWNCLTPEIETFCKENPDYVLYGEAVGAVKGYKYNLKNGEVKFFAFDIMKPSRQYMDVVEFESMTARYSIPTVPIYGHIPYDFSFLLELCESDCPLGNPTSEGIVIKSMVERRNYTTGRVIMKLVNPKYLEKS